MNPADPPPAAENGRPEPGPEAGGRRPFVCDRCGEPMSERHCKAICPNCGGRLDCSDLSIHFD